MKHLSEAQIDEFDEQGFLLLPQWIPTDFVARVCKAAESALDLAVQGDLNGPNTGDMCVVLKDEVPYIGHIIQPHRYLYPACLELLGSPWVLGIAESLCGQGCLSTYNALIAKHREGGEFFPWHQDMTHDRSSRIIVISVFLSEATAAGDGLRVVPRTQSVHQEMPFPLTEEEAAERVIGIGVVPGDVTVHDVMVVHGSRPVKDRERRLVMTFEFRTREHIRTNSTFSDEWIAARDDLQDLERRLYEEMEARAGTESDYPPVADIPECDSHIIETYCNTRCRLETANYGISDKPLPPP